MVKSERSSLGKEFIDDIGGVVLDVNKEDHGDQNSEDNDRVDVTGQECSLKTTRGGIEDDPPRNQKRSQTVIHTGEGFNSGSTTEQKHGGHNNVGTEAEEEERQVGSLSPTSVHNFRNRVSRRRDLLEANGENTKEQNLSGGTRCVPGKRK